MDLFYDEGPVKKYILEKINKDVRLIEDITQIDNNKIEFIMDNLEEEMQDTVITIDDVIDYATNNNLDLNDRELDYISLMLL